MTADMFPSHLVGVSVENGHVPPVKHSTKARFHLPKSKRCGILGLTTGIFFGFLLCFWSKPLPCITNSECCLRQQLREEIRHELIMSQPAQESVKQRKQVLIGVMTAANLIDSRAVAVWKTWAKNINGDVFFFSSEGTPQQLGLPIVSLPGVDDSYPPQKKSFMLVKYLHDFGLDKYDYFMRVDDDVYIHGDRLSTFLSQLNNTKPLFIGQAGIGNSKELGQLGLGTDENFCMGGPGIIFSPETLRRMVPHISYCLQNLLTSHEDVELGRCVRMFAGVPCTWNYEMQKIFYHSYTYATDKTAFPYDLSKAPLDNAITFHPLKSTELMHKLHHELVMKSRAAEQAKLISLRRELETLDFNIDEAKAHSDNQKYQNTTDIVSWTFIKNKHQYEHSSFSLRRNLYAQWKQVINDAYPVVRNVMNNRYASQGLLLDASSIDIDSGYHRFHPVDGIQLLLNYQLDFRRYHPNAFNQRVSKTIALQMPLGDLQIRELSHLYGDTVHLIMPLSGRYEPFLRFLKQFEDVCGVKDMNCDLILILYEDGNSTYTKEAVSRSPYKNKITVLEDPGEFSRADALHKGVLRLPEEALLLFIDVDIYFNEEAILRVRQHSIKGSQAYFPIVFSQFDSDMVCGSQVCPVTDLSKNAGAFRFFGFGIASMYKSDYFNCGGFDLSIHGWGKEDVDLYQKVVRSGLDVFRAPDPALVHIYHPVICSKTLNTEQATMCINSKAASFASKDMLAKMYSKTQGLSHSL